ncbi:MAG TPA: AAA family ATPase [Candidatus Nanoarchaeia archaeon]|nr:AAA family ATPase [Candidatus Nanoarchaeia archaeon]
MTQLLLLYGPSGVGKSTIAQGLASYGFASVELDYILANTIKKATADLSAEDIAQLYRVVGTIADHLLPYTHVVVPEWFYRDESADLVLAQLSKPAEVKISHVELMASRQDILARNKSKKTPIPEDAVLRNFEMMTDLRGKNYIRYDPRPIMTSAKTSDQVLSELLAYLNLNQG